MLTPRVEPSLMAFAQKLHGLVQLLQFDNWPILVLGRLLDRGTGLVVYRKQGLEILVDHRGGDEAGTRMCITCDMYRKHLRDITKAQPMRVLDLGANGGGFPLLLCLEGFSLVEVVCVEMNRSTYFRLVVNLATNLAGAATGINAAVCGVAGSEILLEPSRGSTSLSMTTNRAEASAPHVAVPTTTISTLSDEHFGDQAIDICKMDIEGAEYDALDATPDSVLRRIRNLIIEFHDPARTPAQLSRLRQLGFEDVTRSDARTGDRTEVRAFRLAA